MYTDIDAPEGPDYDREYWWGPLEELGELIKDDSRYKDFDPDDFMVMYRQDRGGEYLIAYKHIHTRRYIHLSDRGVAVGPELTNALEHLELPLGAEMKRNLDRWIAEQQEAEGN